MISFELAKKLFSYPWGLLVSFFIFVIMKCGLGVGKSNDNLKFPKNVKY